MAEDEKREAFEAWAYSNGWEDFATGADGQYRDNNLKLLWISWQARGEHDAGEVAGLYGTIESMKQTADAMIERLRSQEAELAEAKRRVEELEKILKGGE